MRRPIRKPSQSWAATARARRFGERDPEAEAARINLEQAREREDKARKNLADAKRQILELAAEMLEASLEDLESRNGKVYVKGSPQVFLEFREVSEQGFLKRCGAPIIGTGYFRADTERPDPDTHYGNISPAYPFACQIAEVEVDPETGRVTLTDFLAAHDVGRAINPQSVEGQIEGGVVQGVGWALMEEMISQRGRILNPSFTKIYFTKEAISEVTSPRDTGRAFSIESLSLYMTIKT